MIHHGDNLEWLTSGTIAPKSVTLAYLDPPFFTQRDFGAFNDQWADLSSFIQSIQHRAEAIKPLIAPHGCLIVHVDPKTSHYLKVMLDEVYGRDSFQNEIIWRYRRWPIHQPRFQPMHDVLLRYVIDLKACRWNQLYEPLAESTRKSHGTGKQKALFKDGKRLRTVVDDETLSPGSPMSDVWEIPIIAPISKERNGYPTQKPVALMQRLVDALTNPGDTVIDPYMGSASMGEAALRSGRKYLGCDEGEDAVRIARERLAQFTFKSEVY
jgi:site-specific DNA-methyltransferase (adenine-specific)